jgi:hypothetical protein
MKKMCNFFTFLRVIEPNSNDFLCSITVYHVGNMHLNFKICQDIFD